MRVWRASYDILVIAIRECSHQSVVVVLDTISVELLRPQHELNPTLLLVLYFFTDNGQLGLHFRIEPCAFLPCLTFIVHCAPIAAAVILAKMIDVLLIVWCDLFCDCHVLLSFSEKIHS